MATNTKPTLTEFVKRLIDDTTSLISGGLSVPFAIFSIFADSRYAKASFGVLSLIGFLIACYRLWAGERRGTLAVQERLIEEINKRGRPEITVELKEGSGGALHACLMNYASSAAINLRIDDISCRLGTLKFENIPTMISSAFSPNLQCYFAPCDGSAKRWDIVQELIFDAEKNSDISKYTLAIRYTDSDGVLDWVTKCDFGYDFKQKKIVLLKQRIEDGEAENAIREMQEYDLRGSNPSEQAIRWLRKGGYVETTDVTNLDSPEDEYVVTKITDKGRLLLKRRPVGETQTKLLDAQLESQKALLQRSDKIHERQVDSLLDIHAKLDKALFYFQRAASAGKLAGQPSDQELLRMMAENLGAASEEFAKSRLLLSESLGKKLDDFFNKMLSGSMTLNYALSTQMQDPMQRAKWWDEARDTAYKEIPSLLTAIREEAREMIHS